MNILYFLVRPDPQLKGLYSYWSSSLGDAIFLPVAVGACVEFLGRTEIRSAERCVGLVAALGGLTCGTLLQVAWLGDSDIEPNWTIPEPHTFNAAGWYHAGFTCVLLAVGSSLVAKIFWRVFRGVSLKRESLIPLGLAIASSGSFAVLLLIDNAETLQAAASRSTVAACVSVSFVCLLGVIFMSRSRRVKC